MPILQSRVLALIDAADQFSECYDAFYNAISSWIENNPEVPSRDLALYAAQVFRELQPERTTIECLATERTHFKHAASRNVRNAKRMRQIYRQQNPEAASRQQFSDPETGREKRQKLQPIAEPKPPERLTRAAIAAAQKAIEDEELAPARAEFERQMQAVRDRAKGTSITDKTSAIELQRELDKDSETDSLLGQDLLPSEDQQ